MTTRRIYHPFTGRVDTRRRRKLRDAALDLPTTPGVYTFHGYQDRLLYVGKANNLRERVGSYFADSTTRRPAKLRRLLAEIARLEWEACGSELEALLLERRSIAERRPLLNWQHQRFEVYPYLLLTDEAFPRLTLTRAEPAVPTPLDFNARDWAALTGEPLDGEADSGAPRARSRPPRDHRRALASWPLETPPYLGALPGRYVGPFTSPRLAQETLDVVKTLYPLRTCEGGLVPDANGKDCVYGQMGHCGAPCVGKTTQSAYAALCRDLLQLLETGHAPQVVALQERMLERAAALDFETAALLREQLRTLERLAERSRRLDRMRTEHNMVIVQPAVVSSEPDPMAVAVFVVRGGVVRRHLVVDLTSDTAGLHAAIEAVYAPPSLATPYTSKAELDEMMLLDRWLRVHGGEACCVWVDCLEQAPRAAGVVALLQKWRRETFG